MKEKWSSIHICRIFPREKEVVCNKSAMHILRFYLVGEKLFNGRVCPVWCNFYHGYTRRTTIIFGTLKEEVWKSIFLPLNNCFSYRNVFVKICLQTNRFCQKEKLLYILEHTIWFKFRHYVVQIMFGETLDLEC